MRNFIQTGDNLSVEAPADIESGDLFVSAGMVGMAVHDAAMGEVLTITTVGVFTVPKVTGAAWTLGQVLYIDDDGGAGGTPAFTSDATANGQPCAIATAPAVAGAAVGNAKLAGMRI